MPKLKTNKAAKKRFRVTPKGKVLYTKAGRGHLLSTKSRKRKLNLKRKGILHGPDAAMMSRLFPYGQ